MPPIEPASMAAAAGGPNLRCMINPMLDITIGKLASVPVPTGPSSVLSAVTPPTSRATQTARNGTSHQRRTGGTEGACALSRAVPR